MQVYGVDLVSETDEVVSLVDPVVGSVPDVSVYGEVVDEVADEVPSEHGRQVRSAVQGDWTEMVAVQEGPQMVSVMVMVMGGGGPYVYCGTAPAKVELPWSLVSVKPSRARRRHLPQAQESQPRDCVHHDEELSSWQTSVDVSVTRCWRN